MQGLKTNKPKKVLLQNVKVGVKIGVGYAILTSIILIVALVSILNTNSIRHQNHILETVANAHESIMNAQIAQANYEKDGLDETANQVRAYLDTALELSKDPILLAEYPESMVTYTENVENFKREFNSYIALETAKKIKKCPEFPLKTTLSPTLSAPWTSAKSISSLAPTSPIWSRISKTTRVFKQPSIALQRCS